jgi:hypothetical protein
MSRRVAIARPSQHLIRRGFLGLGGNQVATTPTDEQKALIRPIDFDVASKIEGNETQIVTIEVS